jgi:hypothetical protein
MTSPPEPLSPRAQALLDAARDATGPDDAAIVRMRARIAAGAAGGVGVAAATKVVTAGGLGGGAKLALAVLAVTAVGSGAWWITRDDGPSRDRVQPPAKVAVQPSASALPAVPPAVVPPPSAPARSARPDDPPPDVANEPTAPAPRRTPPPPRAKLSLADEVALVDDAMAALRRDDAAAALAAADDHVTTFGRNGQLAEEAAAIRVEALCKLGDGRWSDALDGFDARWPRSAQRPKLSAACKGIQ